MPWGGCLDILYLLKDIEGSMGDAAVSEKNVVNVAEKPLNVDSERSLAT